MASTIGRVLRFCVTCRCILPAFRYSVKNKSGHVYQAARNLMRTYVSGCSSFSCKSHNCGELRAEHEGKEVVLCGWLQFQRMGLFATLRDAFGVTQLVIPSENSTAAETFADLPFESVIQVQGIVQRRPSGNANKNMLTGDVELCVNEVEVLNRSQPRLPFNIRDFQKVKESLRMQFRYLDLRTKTMQRNLRFRSDLVMKMREFLCSRHGFVDVETPTLFRRTPGGAQEFVVPSQLPGKFYSLTQSPQQFKQLLMVGGIDRYFQIAKCYRDEGAKPDRQPEFTQVDIEMSFVNSDCIMVLVEELLYHSWPKESGKLRLPFPRVTYEEAMSQYGSDKPDTRFEMKVHDLSDAILKTDALVLIQNLKKTYDGTVRAIAVKEGQKYLTKSDIDKFTDISREKFGLEGLMFVKVKDKWQWSSMFAKYVPQEIQEDINKRLSVLPHDIIFVTAGPKMAVLSFLGWLRLHIADFLEQKGVQIRSGSRYNFLWITDFPLFLPTAEGSVESAHHPFTAPHPDDEQLLYTEPLKVRSQHYDLVLNGHEIGGGSIRIHRSDIQRYVLNNILKENADDLYYLLKGLDSGCPPHGGIALGLDRLVAILCHANSIRDVIAFPKSVEGKDLMAGAPVLLSAKDAQVYNIQLQEKISPDQLATVSHN